MKYKIPLFASFGSSLAGLALIYSNFPIIAQIFLALAVLMSIGAFKMRAVPISAVSLFTPGIILAFLYFTPGQFPFLSLAMILVVTQNSFIELFFPGKMYNAILFKIVVSVITFSLYFISNILYPAGAQAWIFPGIVLLFVNLLTLIMVTDIAKLKKLSAKGSINVGAPCPEFNLPDEEGNMVSSESLKGNYLLMIFVRGDWCPGCHIMLRCYEKNREKFAERGVKLLSIGPDPLGVNKGMVQKLGLNYHILSDEKQMLARQFSVELQDVGMGMPSEYDFVPLPASFLIDKAGIVRYTSRADKAGEILYPDQIFKVLDSLA